MIHPFYSPPPVPRSFHIYGRLASHVSSSTEKPNVRGDRHGSSGLWGTDTLLKRGVEMCGKLGVRSFGHVCTLRYVTVCVRREDSEGRIMDGWQV